MVAKHCRSIANFELIPPLSLDDARILSLSMGDSC